MSHPRIAWLIGPIGWNISLKVSKFPTEDEGCFASGYKTGIVWDAAILPTLFRREINSMLFGNHLGNSNESKKLRLKLSSHRCKLIEVGTEATTLPIDVIITTKGSRTWISNITPPSIKLIISALRKATCFAIPDIIYCDYFEASDVSMVDLQKVMGSIKPQLLYYNIGDWIGNTPIRRILEASDRVIAQTSLKSSKAVNDLSKIYLSENQFILATRGGGNVLLFKKDSVTEIPVKKLHSIDSVGAGAIFSAAIIDYLLKNLDNWPLILNDAANFAVISTNNSLIIEHRPYHL